MKGDKVIASRSLVIIHLIQHIVKRRYDFEDNRAFENDEIHKNKQVNTEYRPIQIVPYLPLVVHLSKIGTYLLLSQFLQNGEFEECY